MTSTDAKLDFTRKLISAIAAPTCLICQRQWCMANDSLLRLLGISTDESALKAEDLFHADDLQWLDDLCSRYPDGPDKLPLRRQIRLRKDQQETLSGLFHIDVIDMSADSTSSGTVCAMLSLIELEHESDQRGRRLFNNEDVIFVEWRRGDYNLINNISTNVEQFGYAQAEFLSGERSYNDIIHPVDLDWIKQNIDRVMDDEVPYSYWEYRIICKNGELRWVGDFTIADYEHPTISAVSYLLDITPFRKMNDDLSSSRRMYRQLARHLPEMNVILFNSELRLIIVEGTLTFLDKSAEGRMLREALSPEHYEHLLPYFRGALAGHHNNVKLKVEESYYTLDFLSVPAEENGPHYGMLVIEDVTRAYRIQEELRQNRERLDNIIDSVDDIIWSIQAQPFEVLYISEGVLDLYGYTEEEFTFQKNLWTDIIHPEDKAFALGQWGALGRVGASDIEFRIIRKDGQVRWVRSRSKIVIDKASNQMRIDGITTDITARKEGEKALRESEELYRLLAENVADMIARIDTETRFTFVTPSSINVMGYTPEELLNQPLYEFIHPDDTGFVNNLAEESIQAPKTDFQAHFRIKNKSDVWVWVEMTGRALMHPDNQHAGFQFVARDITHRKAAEDALRESEERFRQIAENIHELFYVFENERFTYISPAFENLWGRSPDPVYEEPGAYLDWIYPDDNKRILEALRREREEKIPFNEEYRVLHADGKIHWLWARNFPVMNDDESYHVVGIAEDITERKEAEIALKQSEERFQQIAENINEVFFVRDVSKNRYMYISPAYEKIWQQPVQEVYDDPLNLFKLIHPDDLETMRNSYRLKRDEPQKANDEYRILREDGEIRWIQVRSYPIFNKDGEITHTVGTAEDITERKEAEIALRESEARFQQIAENINEVFYIRDVNARRYLYISPAFETVWQRSPEPLYNNTSNFLETVHPDDVEKIRENWREMRRNPHAESFEYRIIRSDGQIRWINTRNYPIFDDKGNLTLYVGTAEDITERKEAALTLKESEERLQLALKTANLGTWDWNLKTDVITCNDLFYDLMGWDKSLDSPSRSFMRQIIHPEDLPRLREEIALAQSEGFLERTEFRVTRADGTERWLVSQAHVDFDEHGQPTRVMGIVQDVTESKENEERRIKLALAEERSALLAEFLGNMSHDLRTPLTVISTSIDMLERYPLEEENRKRRFGIIRLQTQLLESMFQNILTMSQLDHEKELTVAPVNINRMLREIQESLNAYAEMREIKMMGDYAQNLPIVTASESQLYRAFTNLVKNAINYTGAGGEVILITQQEENRIIVSVADTGIGISEKDLPLIFDRFYRADKARPSDDGGTGLGLAIVKKIMDMHNADIRVKSEPGKGTTFTVRLPIRPWQV